MSVKIAPPFLQKYRLTGRHAPRLERILAIGRAFLAVTALAAIYVDPTEPARFAGLMYSLLTAYALYSVAIAIALRQTIRLTPRTPLALHGLDILWASALTFFSEGPVSPFFLFFLFVLLAAAYRWAFRETFATAVLIVAIFVLQTVIAVVSPWARLWFADIPFEVTPIVTRATYLLLTGALLGYLAEQDKQLRAEIAAAADAVRQPHIEVGFSGSISAIAGLLCRTFRAASVDIVIHDFSRGRTMLWSVHGQPDSVDTTAPARGVQLTDRRKRDLAVRDAGPHLVHDRSRRFAGIFSDGARFRVVRAASDPDCRTLIATPAPRVQFTGSGGFRTRR